jgi:predicted dehydrogenase
MRVAVFGLGGVAERIHLPACRAVEGLEVVAACEPDPLRRERVGRRFAIPALYADAETLLDRERPDLVLVGTPPDSHHGLSRLALLAGAHVLCEKPFVSSLEEADELIETASRVGRTVRVNNQYRYMPIYAETRRRIEAGDFGEPYLAQFWQQMFHPPRKETNWRASLKESTLYEFGTHALDLCCFLFGSLPETVSAAIPEIPGEPTDVVVHVTLRFPGERLALVTLNRISRAPMRYLEARVDCREASIRISLGGVARLSLEWSPERRRPRVRAGFARGGEARVERDGRSIPLVREPLPAFASATAAHLREMVASIRSGRTDLAAARHAREVLRIVFAAYESARRRETVRLGAP